MTSNPWLGEYRPHNHFSFKNIVNAALCVLIIVLWTKAVDYEARVCQTYPEEWTQFSSMRAYLCMSPILTVSILLLFCISLLFWVIGLMQRSFWLIDPFWTFIPLMIAHAYIQHPKRPEDFSVHFCVVMELIGIAAIRLTYSYFRRERFKFGEREDWRYSLLSKKLDRHWWWVSFWAVGFIQQILLTGLTLPIYSTLFHPKSDWSALDSVAVFFSLLGIGIAFSADNELHRYMSTEPKPAPILRTGMWCCCRHPNYFGEQLFWWSLSLFSVSHGDVWALFGPLLNTLVLIETTRMTENRMLSNWCPERRSLYEKYQRTTSVWIPWINRWDKV